MRHNIFNIDPQKEWEEFWEPIISRAHDQARELNEVDKLIPAPISVAELEQIKLELSDYSFLIRAVPIVYDDATGGRCTKPNTDPYTVISLIDERTQDAINDILREVVNALRTEYDHGLGHIQDTRYNNPADFIAHFFGVRKED